MLLAVDIGNTNIAIGVFRNEELLRHWDIKAERDKTCDEYKITLINLISLSGLEVKDVQDMIISSVVPPLTPVFQNLCHTLFHMKPRIVGPGMKTGMSILYENPLEVGADRIVSAVAVFEEFGGPCIVVDFGTATTFDVISSQGEYMGGAIAPGVQIAAEALYLKTAKLPQIEIIKPKQAIGRTTVASMQSGLYFGYIGLVKNIIDRLKEELDDEVKVVATGGFASVIFSEIESIDFCDPQLVLKGLRLLYEKNR